MGKETFSTNGFECPYCGYLSDDSESIHDQKIETFECGSCEKTFYASAEISWDFTASKRGREGVKEDIERQKKNMESNLQDEKEGWNKDHNKAVKSHYEHRIKMLEIELKSTDY